ncbi:MAG: hypothetical protein KBD50_01165 [Candidatus Pacebacteria bacterium]|nr:hypothetical protein [Candidatus Paceibacterota bacterium]
MSVRQEPHNGPMLLLAIVVAVAVLGVGCAFVAYIDPEVMQFFNRILN